MPLLRKPVMFPTTGNRNWPLPADYDSMSASGKRMARLNACCLQTTPKLSVSAWTWFCKYYLWPEPKKGFDPQFYKPPLHKPGALHYRLVEAWETHRLSACAAPRGSAKSTSALTYVLFKVLTNPQYEINLYRSGDKAIIEAFNRLKFQLDHNPRILEDFGRMAPTRGDGVWSAHMLQFNTQAWLRGYSIDGTLRGPRSNFSLVDDVEADEDGPVQKIRLTRQQLADKMLTVIVPTLDAGHLGIIGTILPESLLYKIVQPVANLPEADRDDRFADDLWHKINVTAEDKNNPWAAKFTPEFLSVKRRIMGIKAYGQEYLGRPVSGEGAVFDIRPDFHEYEINITEDHPDPFQRQGTITYNEVAGLDNLTLQKRTLSYQQWLGSLKRFIVVDYAHTVNPDSDYSVIHTLGVDSRNDLWSLDLWSQKVYFPFLVRRIWEQARIWRVSTVAPEAYTIQEAYVRLIREERTRLGDLGGFVPVLFPLKPPTNMPKGIKILRLESRFGLGKVKFPRNYLTQDAYKRLYTQVLGFQLSPLGDVAGLSHDDELDTLAMTVDFLKGGSPKALKNHSPQNPFERIMQGEMDDESGMPLALGLRWNQMTPQAQEMLIDACRRNCGGKLAGHLSYATSDDIIDVDGVTIDDF